MAETAWALEQDGSPATVAAVLELALIDLICRRALDKDAAIAAVEDAAETMEIARGGEVWRDIIRTVNSLYAAHTG